VRQGKAAVNPSLFLFQTKKILELVSLFSRFHHFQKNEPTPENSRGRIPETVFPFFYDYANFARDNLIYSYRASEQRHMLSACSDSSARYWCAHGTTGQNNPDTVSRPV
jgi:hypothetical protein